MIIVCCALVIKHASLMPRPRSKRQQAYVATPPMNEKFQWREECFGEEFKEAPRHERGFGDTVWQKNHREAVQNEPVEYNDEPVDFGDLEW